MNIKKSIYEGYLWYSNAQSPQVIDKEEFELTIDDNHNPFIVEGQLCDVHNRHSISIKFVDGQYIIKEYDFTEDDFSNPEIEVKTFLSNRMEVKTFLSNRMEGKKLQFLQYWRAEKDPLCEHMEVLQSAELVFVGFDKNTKEENL